MTVCSKDVNRKNKKRSMKRTYRGMSEKKNMIKKLELKFYCNKAILAVLIEVHYKRFEKEEVSQNKVVSVYRVLYIIIT